MKRLYNLLACVLVCAFAISCEYGAMMDGVYYPEMDGAAMPEEGEPDPGEGDRFDEIKDNAFIKTSEQNVSTFSIDADGAAYGYMRQDDH